MILSYVKHYEDSNSVEAQWVDADGNQVKCHSYADVQMDMLIEDLGEDAEKYLHLIEKVKAAHVPEVISEEQLKTLEREWRNLELGRVDIIINKIQDGMYGFGSIGPWRSYRVDLRNWPENPEFPKIENRPVAPDA